jgi:hypothetical protein
MKKYRKEGRQNVGWHKHNIEKCCQATYVHGILTTMNASNCLIAVYIISSEGCLQGVGLIFKAGMTSGHYHGQMNADNFEKLIKEVVIWNLPSASIIVMDNSPYCSRPLIWFYWGYCWVLFRNFLYFLRGTLVYIQAVRKQDHHKRDM